MTRCYKEKLSGSLDLDELHLAPLLPGEARSDIRQKVKIRGSGRQGRD